LPVASTDPTEPNRWRPLWLLLRRLDDEIVQVYVDAGIPDFRSRFTMPLVRLSRLGPMSIKALAAECDVTHSAMSQTVTAMRKAGLVDSVPDPTDGRARLIDLTGEAQRIVTLGEAEWAATEAVLEELEAETPYPMSRVVRDLEAALERRGFTERLREHMEER
jgi:DNA-binding MarR family transcriptional regulator